MNEINQSFWFFMTDGLKTKSTDDNDNVIYILHKKTFDITDNNDTKVY